MTEAVEKGLKKIGITVSKPALAALCILFGITVILWKESLNIVIGVFLIAEGFLLLTDYAELRKQQRQPSSTR